MEFKIVNKYNPNIVYASGFYGMDRVNKWISEFNPRMWMDKTLTVADLKVIEVTRKYHQEAQLPILLKHQAS